MEIKLKTLIDENKKSQSINAIIMKDNRQLAKKLKDFQDYRNHRLFIENQYSIDLNKQTFDRTDYLKLSAFVKSSFVVAENKGTSIKDNIIAYISKNLGQVLFVEPMINKIFGTNGLNAVMNNRKLLVTHSEEQTDKLKQILKSMEEMLSSYQV